MRQAVGIYLGGEELGVRDAQPAASRAGAGQCLLSRKALVPGRTCGRLRLGISVHWAGQHCAVGHCRAQQDRLPLELTARGARESSPKWALKGILVLFLFSGRLYGFVFNVPISDFLKMWLT